MTMDEYDRAPVGTRPVHFFMSAFIFGGDMLDARFFNFHHTVNLKLYLQRVCERSEKDVKRGCILRLLREDFL